MKKIILLALATVILATSVAFAGEIKDVGIIENISLNGPTATVELKGKTGKFTVKVTDSLTVDKMKDKRISNGDEVRVKYDSDSKVTKLFKKTAGC
ncbi:MAG: hypothetical protein PHZ26_03460 [Candidatus Gracilibacteria bacterium]|nr:hypothetical protein [Candidatus Gracilibacteria bacterium]